MKYEIDEGIKYNIVFIYSDGRIYGAMIDAATGAVVNTTH